MLRCKMRRSRAGLAAFTPHVRGLALGVPVGTIRHPGARHVACDTRHSEHSAAPTSSRDGNNPSGDTVAPQATAAPAAPLATGHAAMPVLGNPRLDGHSGTSSNAARSRTLSSTDDEDDTGDEAGGCVAVWDETFWTRPSAVRQHLLDVDPGLNQNLISSGTTIAQIFNQDMWERHRQPNRYWLYMSRMLHSTVLRRIFRPVISLTLLSAAVCGINSITPQSWPRLAMSMVPHTLLGAALSLLLVFRTNSSYARFVEGRALWGALVRYSRDWVRLAATHFHGELRGRAARYIQVLAFVLKGHLRSGRTRASSSDPSAFRDDPTQVVEELLPCEEASAVLVQHNRPFFVLCRMTQVAKEAAAAGAPKHVMHTLEHTLSELLAVCGGCDRILGTPIPLSYTRHTSRSLVLWLTTLPVALWPVTGWLTVPAMMVFSFIFLGIDEIGVEIEEPFCILPLHPLCRTIVNDTNMAMAMEPAI